MNKVTKILITIVIVSILVFGGIILFKIIKENKQNNLPNNAPINNDQKQIDDKKDNLFTETSETIKYTKTYKVQLENKIIEVPIQFIGIKEDKNYDSYDSRYIIGELSGVKIFINCSESGKEYKINNKKDLESDINNLELYNLFSTNNFKVIKGTDNKEYIIVVAYEGSDATMAYHYYAFNTNLECINKDKGIVIEYAAGTFLDENDNAIKLYDSNDLGFKIDNLIETPQIRAKIKDNKIYALYWTSNENDKDYLEEREYYINNNQFYYNNTGEKIYFETVVGALPANYP